MNGLEGLLCLWKSDPTIVGDVSDWKIQTQSSGDFAGFPEDIFPFLREGLIKNGIISLYRHQYLSWNLARKGCNLAVVTGTASGKTLCYNLPILNSYLTDKNCTALYLFPTKALAQDQLDEIRSLLLSVEVISSGKITDIGKVLAIYDGDTPSTNRVWIRNNARLLFSNPDMLHLAILPHHTQWGNFIQNLKYVVLDEMHIYRGVFGSHIANVIRRLKRICTFYGSRPQFILASATIANPKELAESLIEDHVELVDVDYASHGEKHQIIINPPVINRDTGIRKSASSEALRLVQDLMAYQVQTLVFTRTRKGVEMALRSLRENNPGVGNAIQGYRSGYLPVDRRAIEKNLRSGKSKAVIATNALELGIDIGGIDVAVLIGYPGSIAATRQQLGRAGRKTEVSAGILVTSASPIDQYLARHPEFLTEKSPESALVNPDNLLIILQHIRCAAFELPINIGEGFGNAPQELVDGLLKFLEGANILHCSAGRYYWVADKYPAQEISLRSGSNQRVQLLLGVGNEKFQTLGEVDQESASWMVHPGAIYLHNGESHEVISLDLENHKAYLKISSEDYYTEPLIETTIELIKELNSIPTKGGSIHFGEVVVTTQVTGYKKVRWYTQEKFGEERINLPPTVLDTTAFWLTLNDTTIAALREEGMWTNDQNRYGANWPAIRTAVLHRDNFTCQLCGEREGKTSLHVHHKTPFRSFSDLNAANHLNNLLTLCPACHKRVEVFVRIRSGLSGLCYLIHQLAPLFIMCDVNDLGALSDPQSSLSDGLPTLILYDLIPAGIGLSEAVFRKFHELIVSAQELVSTCACQDGCPSCVGPGGENGSGGKEEVMSLLKELVE